MNYSTITKQKWGLKQILVWTMNSRVHNHDEALSCTWAKCSPHLFMICDPFLIWSANSWLRQIKPQWARQRCVQTGPTNVPEPRFQPELWYQWCFTVITKTGTNSASIRSADRIIVIRFWVFVHVCLIYWLNFSLWADSTVASKLWELKLLILV